MAMPDGDAGLGWDFITFVTAWCLYALPALLLAVALYIFVKRGRIRNTDHQDIAQDGRRIVIILALIHLTLVVHGALLFAQELLTMRVMGVTQSFFHFVSEALAIVVNSLVALGFYFARPMSRWIAIAWYLLLSAIGLRVALWLWHFHVPFKAWTWPDYLAGKAMPVFLLVVMFLPRVKRVFARPMPRVTSRGDAEAAEPRAATSKNWSLTAIVAALFLIVVVSNLAVGTADWIERWVTEWNQTEESY
jgi:hypothetical protein